MLCNTYNMHSCDIRPPKIYRIYCHQQTIIASNNFWINFFVFKQNVILILVKITNVIITSYYRYCKCIFIFKQGIILILIKKNKCDSPSAHNCYCKCSFIFKQNVILILAKITNMTLLMTIVVFVSVNLLLNRF